MGAHPSASCLRSRTSAPSASGNASRRTCAPASGRSSSEDDAGICGTVQLVLDLPENQPHRADLVKMLVHRRARRRGLAASLMRAAESTALDCGRDLLVLDAVTGGDAERLYTRLGWQRVGIIPRFALMPDGTSCATTFFYKDLGSALTPSAVI